MEKYILKAVFMLTLISIVSSGLIFAANKTDRFIGDTGKLTRKFYIKELRAKDRAMKELSPEELDSIARFLIFEGDTGKYYRKFFFKDGIGLNKRFVDSLILKFPKDSVFRGFRFHADSIFENRGRLFPDRHDNSIEMPNMLRKGFPRMHIDRFDLPDRIPGFHNNSQSFNFRNTDKDGITTKIRIDVDEPSEEELEKMSGKVSESRLNVQDLSFSPLFSSNKIMLMFTTPTKGSASIKVLDGDFRELFSDQVSQVSGTYNKAISLPKNGIYFLVITQNKKSFIKRIIKQG